ncbi:MAG: Ig-like domain-containing protein [Candidatus Woykebacteria bacterium]
MRATDLFKHYRRSINPPYKGRDYLVIVATVVILLAIPATVLLAFRGLNLGGRAAIVSKIWLEAENGQLTSPMTEGTDISASGGKFVSSTVTNTAFDTSNGTHEHSPQVLQATPWAFEETFDGAPGSPLPFSSPRWDVVIDSNNIGGIMEGQENGPPITNGHIELGHGSACQGPIGNMDPANNIHTVDVDFDDFGFQKNTRPFLNFICNNHMMSVAKSGYGISTFMPRQYFDWAGRTGTLEFETSLYTFGREWWDVYITPEKDELLSAATIDEGATYEQLPERAVKITMVGNKPRVQRIENYEVVDGFTHWEMMRAAFPNDPAPSLDPTTGDPRLRRVVRFKFNVNSWQYEIQKQDGSFWTFNGTWSAPLPFTRGLVKFEHHAYNPTKDGGFGSPWSQYTYHWDNIRFDGPVIPAHTAFDPGSHFVNLLRDPDPNFTRSEQINVNVPAADIKNPVLVGHICSDLNHDLIDFANKPQGTTHWRQFRVNGREWQNIWLVKNVPAYGPKGNRCWSTFKNSISGVVSGNNTIEFRYPYKPTVTICPLILCPRNGYNVKDIEIRIDPVGSTTPPQPSDTDPPTVQITSPANNAAVSGNVTVNATASDSGTGVDHVMFMANGASLVEDYNAPYTVNWDSTTVFDGQNNITAMAFDKAGNQKVASITVNTSNGNPRLPTNTGSSVIPFSVPEAGNYTVWTRMLAANAGSDSYWLRIDNQKGIKVGDGGLTFGNYLWVNHQDGDLNKKISVSLSTGSHSLTIIGREAGARIDRLLVTNETNFIPTGKDGDGDQTQDNENPIVNIVSPLNHTTVAGPINVDVTATDNVGVAKVELYLDGVTNKLGEDISSASGLYSVAWDTTSVNNGDHMLIAKVYDAAGNSSMSNSITVNVDNIPDDQVTVDFADLTVASGNPPLDGQYPTGLIDWGSGNWVLSKPFDQFSTVNFSFNGPTINQGSFTLLTSATLVSIDADNGGSSTSTVTLKCSGNPDKQVSIASKQTITITTGWTSPCTTVMISSSNGWDTNFDNIVLKILGGTIPPPPVDTIKPTVSVTSPKNGAAVSKTVPISATATDNVKVVRVDFYIDGVKKGSDTTASYTYSWNTASYSNGTHKIQAKAVDSSGLEGPSSTISVTVSNSVLKKGKPGDLDGDGKVNIFDLSILLSKWGTTDKSANLNTQGRVDIFDLSILLSNWGS